MWPFIAVAAAFFAGFLIACLNGGGSGSGAGYDHGLQEPTVASPRWLIVTRPKQRYEFDVDNETDALREFFKKKGDPAKIIESRPL